MVAVEEQTELMEQHNHQEEGCEFFQLKLPLAVNNHELISARIATYLFCKY